jgi:hypothetical protein
MHKIEASMRTTVDLDEARLEELMRLLKVRTKRAALEYVIEEGIRRARAEEVIAMEGTLTGLRDWREQKAEEARLERQKTKRLEAAIAAASRPRRR